MRIHLEIVLGAAAVALALGTGCARHEGSQGASAPTTYIPYSTTNAGSNAYGNAGTGYSTTPTATGGGPSSTSSTTPPSSTSAPSSTGSSTDCANGNCESSGSNGFDHHTIQGTGSTDNVPTGVGGGPIDKGTTNPDNGVTNDDDTDKSLDPGAGDHGKSDVPQPLDKSKGKKGKTKMPMPPDVAPEEGM